MPTNRRPLLILCPMVEEMDAVLALGDTAPLPDVLGFHACMLHVEGSAAVAIRCGVGKIQAAMVTQRAIDLFAPRAIVLTGVAGALHPDLRPGDAIVARDTLQHDMDVTALGFELGEVPFSGERLFSCDPTLVAKACAAVTDGTVRVGRILTGDRFVTGADRACHAHLRDILRGDAVEMEGAAVAQVCSRNGVPCVIIRTISDRANGDAPADFVAVLAFAAANAAAVIRGLLATTRPD